MEEMKEIRLGGGKKASLPGRAYRSNDGLKFIEVRFLYSANICRFQLICSKNQ